MKLLSLLMFIFLIFGCSTTIKNFFDDGETSSDRNEKLVKEDFKEESKVFEKFKEVKKPEPKKVNVKEKDKKRKAILPKKTKRKLKPLPKKKIAKIVKKKNPEKVKTPKTEVVTEVEAGPNYPGDFPEDLKDYDRKSEGYWGSFNPTLFPGEKVVFNITYLGVNTGKITLSTKADTQLGDHSVYHVHARIKTADFYSYLYEVDDYCDSYIKKGEFIPAKFSLIQRQSSQDIDDLQLFDQGEFKAYSFYKRVTSKKNKKKKDIGFTPYYFQDPLSVLYFLRGLPMQVGAKYTIPIINRAEVETLRAEYEKVETIKTKIGKKKAHRWKIYSAHKGETIKGGHMTFWFSADERKVFLKFQAKIKIGSISGEIESYKK